MCMRSKEHLLLWPLILETGSMYEQHWLVLLGVGATKANGRRAAAASVVSGLGTQARLAFRRRRRIAIHCCSRCCFRWDVESPSLLACVAGVAATAPLLLLLPMLSPPCEGEAMSYTSALARR